MTTHTATTIVELYRQGRSLERQGSKKVKAAIQISYDRADRDEIWIQLAELAEASDKKNGNHNEISALRMRIREVCKADDAPVLTVKRLSKGGQFQVVEADAKPTDETAKYKKAAVLLAGLDTKALLALLSDTPEFAEAVAKAIQAAK